MLHSWYVALQTQGGNIVTPSVLLKKAGAEGKNSEGSHPDNERSRLRKSPPRKIRGVKPPKERRVPSPQ